MSLFTGPLKVEFLSAKSSNGISHARLLEDLIWEAGEEGSQCFIIVPAAHISDGISVPRLLWWLVPPHGHPASRAARLHDYMLDRYRLGQAVIHAETRKALDHEFYLALKACGISNSLARLMWMAVRLNAWWRMED